MEPSMEPSSRGPAQVPGRLKFRENPFRSTKIGVEKGHDVLDDPMESELIIRS